MISWCKGWLHRHAAPMCQARESSTTSVCNLAGFIHLDPPALLMNGLCVVLQPFWLVLLSTQPSRCISQQFARCVSTKAFLILLWIVCGCGGCLEELKELKMMLLLYAYQLEMTSWWRSFVPWICASRITACFGQHVT